MTNRKIIYDWQCVKEINPKAIFRADDADVKVERFIKDLEYKDEPDKE